MESEMCTLLKTEIMQLHMNPIWLIFILLATNASTLAHGITNVLLHTSFVTYTLLCILVDIKEIFKRLTVPYNKYRKFIITFGWVHLLNPLVLLFEHKYVVYVHLIMCFLLHVMHIHYIILVFRKMNYIDKYYYKILLFLNICQVFTNLCLICKYKDMYKYAAIMTESVCACSLTYKRKRPIHRKRNVTSFIIIQNAASNT